MPSFLSNLEWRRAVKKFVPGPKIDTTPIREAIVAAPTSFGLQPYRVRAIRDPALKAALRPLSYGQPQVTDCDTLFVFCARYDVETRAEEYLTATGAEGMRDMLMGFLKGMPDWATWADRQTYIALGFALAAAAEAQIASCPMEGFNPVEVSRVLKLPATERALAFLAVGHTTPGEEGVYPRFRFPASDLIENRDA
jgi:nitroreductase/dihydropteridine reductase